MRRIPSLPWFAPLSLVVAVAAPPAGAQEVPARAAPVFENGEAQPVEAFSRRRDWIREFLWVEAPFDSDGDGRNDRLHVDVTRPQQTATEGLKVPVVYETSPYFAGTGPMDLGYFWDTKHELGAEPPPRAPMPPIGFGAEPGMISASEVGKWLPRGYAVVHSSSPGTGWSQGCATVGGANESLAPKAVIDWLCGRARGFKTIDGDEEVRADWCSGKVGMIGTSYNGTLPIAAATTGVQGLEAVIPIAPNTSYYHYYRSNGLVRHPGGYMGEDVDVLFDFISSGEPTRRRWCIEHVRDGVLRRHHDRVRGDYNDFWAERDYLGQLADYRAATLMAHGFNDWNVMPEHSVRIYVALKQKGVPCLAYFHQEGHGGDPPFSLMNRWFTRFLHGVDNGVEHGPRSWIVREGDRTDRKPPTAYDDYPHPEAAPVTLHPGGDGLGIGTLTLAAVAGAGPTTIVDDVSKSGADLASAAASPHRLLFATAPLQQPLHLSGVPRLSIRVASDKPAVNLSVWLVSLPWTDARRLTDDVITRGWADPQNDRSLRESSPLVPGEFRTLEFDLQPDDQVIAAGERIGLMLFATDRDFTLLPPPGTKLIVDVGATRLSLPVVGGPDAVARAVGEAR